MPSNHILINNSAEYIVVDSKMDELLRWLDTSGHPVNTSIKIKPDQTDVEVISCIPKQA